MSVDSKFFVGDDAFLGKTIYPIDADSIPHVSLTDKCIVLDLDLTLLCTQDNIQSLFSTEILTNPQLLELRNRVYYFTVEDVGRPGDGEKIDMWGVTRPHIKEFLLFCFSYFKIVAVWSAGQRLYVEAIVNYMFKDLPKPHIIFTADDTVFQNDHTYKPLSYLMSSNPVVSRIMTPLTTLAIDDNSSTFAYNKDNAVLIPAYSPSPNINSLSRDDPSLLQLKYWLLQPEVVAAQDVRKLNKSTIFSTPVAVYKKKLAGYPGYNFGSF